MKEVRTSRLPKLSFMILGLAGLLGILFGLGTFTVGYAEGLSYASNDPEACSNCHIMREQYDGWLRGSHRSVATCNDCHLPHDFVGKWTVKATNGYRHSRAFTTGDFHEPIQITERNARIAQESCLHCHDDFVSQIAHAPSGEEMDCVHCHGSVGHNAFPRVAASAP